MRDTLCVVEVNKGDACCLQRLDGVLVNSCNLQATRFPLKRCLARPAGQAGREREREFEGSGAWPRTSALLHWAAGGVHGMHSMLGVYSMHSTRHAQRTRAHRRVIGQMQVLSCLRGPGGENTAPPSRTLLK